MSIFCEYPCHDTAVHNALRSVFMVWADTYIERISGICYNGNNYRESILEFMSYSKGTL